MRPIRVGFWPATLLETTSLPLQFRSEFHPAIPWDPQPMHPRGRPE